MEHKVIKTKKEYKAAMTRLENIFDATSGTKEGDELELLTLLIDNYENNHFPIESPDPIEAIKFRMEQMDYKNKDIARIFGFRSRVSEILNKKRKLNLSMIRRLNQILHIPTDILVKEY